MIVSPPALDPYADYDTQTACTLSRDGSFCSLDSRASLRLSASSCCSRDLVANEQANLLELALVEGGRAEVVGELLELLDESQRQALLARALPVAGIKGHVAVVAALLEVKADAGTALEKLLGSEEAALTKAWGAVLGCLLERAAPSGRGAWEGFLLAARHSHVEAIAAIVGGGLEQMRSAEGDPNARDARKQTPVHLAVKVECGEVLELMLDKQGDANLRDGHCQTPLHLAAKASGFGMVRLLLERRGMLELEDDKGRTPLHLAVSASNLRTVGLILERRAALDSKDKRGRTPLHLAAGVRVGNVQMVELILKKRGTVDAEDDNQWTPLHHAATGSNTAVMSAILGWIAEDKGLSEVSRRLDSEDSFGRLPLHLAAVGGHAEMVQLLLEQQCGADSCDEAGQSAAHLAAAKGHSTVLAALITHGARLDAEDRSGKAPVHLAFDNGQHEAVALLLGGSDVLHSSAKAGYLAIVSACLANGAQEVNTQSKSGTTALHLAAESGRQQVLATLLQRRADLHAAAVKDGRTALHCAAAAGHRQLVAILLDRGSRLAAAGRDGRTAVHLAAVAGQQAVVAELLARGAPLNRRDKLSQTALHLAARRGHLAVVAELLRGQAKPDRPDCERKTPLCLAVEGRHERVARELIARGADKREPFELAMQNRSLGMVSVFVRELVELDELKLRRLLREENPRVREVFEDLRIPVDGCPQPFESVVQEWEKGEKAGMAYMSGFLRLVYLRKSDGHDEVAEEHNRRQIARVKQPLLTQALQGVQLARCSLEVIAACPLEGLISTSVVEALAQVPSQQVLLSDTAYAIVSAAWKSVRVHYACDLLFKAAVVAAVVCACYEARTLGRVDPVGPALLAAKAGLKLLDELIQVQRLFHGESRLFRFAAYLLSLGTLTDWAAVALDAAAVVVMRSFVGHVWERGVLACCVAANWLMLLYATRGFEVFGPRLLPILFAVRDARPFLVVVALCLAAATSAFYCLATREEPWPIYAALLPMLRLGPFGDFDLFELEGLDTAYVPSAGDHGRLEPLDPEPSDNFIAVQVLFFAVGCSITVVLMNLLIGVLSNSYDRHEDMSRVIFLQHRANMYVNMRTGAVGCLLQGLERLLHTCGRSLRLCCSKCACCRRLCPCVSNPGVDNGAKTYLGIIRREDFRPEEDRSFRGALQRSVGVLQRNTNQKLEKLQGDIGELRHNMSQIEARMEGKQKEILDAIRALTDSVGQTG